MGEVFHIGNLVTVLLQHVVQGLEGNTLGLVFMEHFLQQVGEHRTELIDLDENAFYGWEVNRYLVVLVEGVDVLEGFQETGGVEDDDAQGEYHLLLDVLLLFHALHLFRG